MDCVQSYGLLRAVLAGIVLSWLTCHVMSSSALLRTQCQPFAYGLMPASLGADPKGVT